MGYAESEAGATEDVNHPIPRLDVLDTVVTTERGAYVGILISTPLRDDPISRARLRRKIELSLGYFAGADYLARFGPADPAHSKLYLSVHANSDAGMIELIEQYCAQFPASGVAAVLELSGTN